MFKISRSVNYRNFGFIPRGNFVRDLYGKLFGYPNLSKRLTAREIMRALDLKPQQTVLDFGCGYRGYFTVEIAKKAKLAVGLDINKLVNEIKVPDSLKDKLQYVVIDSTDVPFEDNTFDVILASEVIAVVPDPGVFLKEWRRLLKPGGRLVMINGTGRDSIRRCYDRQAIRMKALKFLFKKRWPSEFDEYIKAINIQFGNEKSVFYDVNSMDEMIARNQFERSSCRYMSTGYGGELLEWQQFIRYLRGKKVLAKNWFVPTYWIFSFLKMIGRNTNATAILYVAKNKKNSH